MENFDILIKLAYKYKETPSSENKQKIKEFLIETKLNINDEDNSFFIARSVSIILSIIILTFLTHFVCALMVGVIMTFVFSLFPSKSRTTIKIVKDILKEDLVKKYLDEK